jgi:hypothetical protein
MFFINLKLWLVVPGFISQASYSKMEEHKLERMDSNLVCVEEIGEEVQLNTSRKDALLSVRTEDMIGRYR